jgi:hypothetical protein
MLPVQGGGVEAVLSQAQTLLANGRLMEAADVLEAGSKSTAVAPMVAEVRPLHVH